MLFDKGYKAAAAGERHFKASGTDTGTKRGVIFTNAEKYSISAMCKVLKISRNKLYYKDKPKAVETEQ